MRYTLLLLGLVLVLMVPGASATASTGDQYVNVSGPDFLKPYGPHDPRIDNPVAAGIVAIGVAAVILRGLREHDQ